MSITHLKYWTFELNPNPQAFRHTHCILGKMFFEFEEESNSRFNLLQIGPWTFGPWTLLSKKWP
jgi:hypothetical protein